MAGEKGRKTSDAVLGPVPYNVDPNGSGAFPGVAEVTNEEDAEAIVAEGGVGEAIARLDAEGLDLG